MNEAHIRDTPTGRIVDGQGWFILNVGEISWDRLPQQGIWCSFEAPEAPSAQFGIGVHVLEPGQANGRYHAETDQEGFLVLSGECTAIVEGTERHMRQWDYLHCPPGTAHITVGAGNSPCAILMVGARSPDKAIHYPVEPLAAPYNASVSQPTDSSREAYADLDGTITPERAPWP